MSNINITVYNSKATQEAAERVEVAAAKVEGTALMVAKNELPGPSGTILPTTRPDESSLQKGDVIEVKKGSYTNTDSTTLAVTTDRARLWYNGNKFIISVAWNLPTSIPIIPNSQISTLNNPQPYIIDTTNNQYMLEISKNGNNIRQYRLLPNIGGEPQIAYQDSNDGGVTWGSLTLVQALTQSNYAKLINSTQWNNVQEPGEYILVVSSGKFKISVTPYSVSSGGGVTHYLRATRVINNSNNLDPQLVYSDKVLGANAWPEWTPLIFSIDGVIDNVQLNSLNKGGIYKVKGTNPYPVFSSVSGGVVRHMRLMPNFGGNPYWAFRDDFGEWTAMYNIESSEQKSFDTNEDIIWSWWTRDIFIRSTSIYNKIYVAFCDSLGNTGVYEKNLESGVQIKTNVKPIKSNPDDHSSGSLIRLASGKILLMMPSGHNENNLMYVYRSKTREDSKNWDKLAEINTGVLTSYAQSFYIDGVIYLFFRGRNGNTSWDWYMLKSEDEGATWSTKKKVLTNTSQWYIFFQRVHGNDTLLRMAHSANSTLGVPIKGGFLDLDSEKVFDTDGITLMGSLGDDINASNFTDIIELASGCYERLLDVKVSNVHDWQILHCVFTNQSDGIYYHFDNGIERLVKSAGGAFYNGSRYYGGGCFGEDGIVYTSRRAIGFSWVEQHTLSGGAYSTTNIIEQTPRHAMRPLYKDGMLIYHKGLYNNSYTDFQMELIIKEV